MKLSVLIKVIEGFFSSLSKMALKHIEFKTELKGIEPGINMNYNYQDWYFG